MLLNFSHLKNLPVFTQSGLHLGHVSDLEIDTESQSVLRYLVQRGRLIGRFQEPLLIHRHQVISISPEKIVVEDAVIKLAEGEKSREKVPQPAPSGVSARQLDS